MEHYDGYLENCKAPMSYIAQLLQHEAGLYFAQIKVALDIFLLAIKRFFPKRLAPGTIVHCAVSADEPAGKPIINCKIVPVHLTIVHENDMAMQDSMGTVELRAARIHRLAVEAQEQGGLLSCKDISYILGINVSTVKDLIKKLRSQNIIVPTRGRVKDIGRGTSHKKAIAELLAAGKTTSEIKVFTAHSEHSIGRYQQQFAYVIFLTEKYPRAEIEQIARISKLSVAAVNTYTEVYNKFADCPVCRPHLQRLRKRYEMDPNGRGLGIDVPGKLRPKTSNNRIEQHTLKTKIRQLIQEDLGLTKRVAQIVAEDVNEVVDKAFALSGAHEPGEMTMFCDAQNPAYISGEKVSDRPITSVKVPVYTEKLQKIWRNKSIHISKRRALLSVIIANAASKQGGIMTIAQLAEIVHTSPSTLARNIRKLAIETGLMIATKGSIEDAGPTITHKNIIIKLDLHGLTGEEISLLTRHSPFSRDRYIETYRRAETVAYLEARIPDADHLARVLNIPKHIAKQYADLLNEHWTPLDVIRERPPNLPFDSPPSNTIDTIA